MNKFGRKGVIGAMRGRNAYLSLRRGVLVSLLALAYVWRVIPLVSVPEGLVPAEAPCRQKYREEDLLFYSSAKDGKVVCAGRDSFAVEDRPLMKEYYPGR